MSPLNPLSVAPWLQQADEQRLDQRVQLAWSRALESFPCSPAYFIGNSPYRTDMAAWKMTLPPTAKLADQEVFNPGRSPLQRIANPSPAGPTHIVAGSSGETPTTSFAGMLDPATETLRVTVGPPYTEACADDCAVGRPARSEPSSSEPVGVGRRRQLERDWRSPPACGLDPAVAPHTWRPCLCERQPTLACARNPLHPARVGL